jgi:hypothetical protein
MMLRAFLPTSFALCLASLIASLTSRPVRPTLAPILDALPEFAEINLPSRATALVLALVSVTSRLSARSFCCRYLFTRAKAFVFPVIILVLAFMNRRALMTSVRVA